MCVQFNAKKFSSRKERADGIHIDKAIYVVTKNIDNVKVYKKKWQLILYKVANKILQNRYLFYKVAY